jgi:hypothetical protein
MIRWARVYILAVVLLLALSVGCFRTNSRPAPPPAPAPTRLVTADVDALIQRAVATQKDACQWQQGGNSAGSSVSSGPSANSMTAHKEVIGSLKCQPEVLDEVLRALKAELEKEAQAAGVPVHDPSEVVKEGRLEGLGFEYTAGSVRGEVKAGAERDASAAEHSYKLTVGIDEKAP